MIRPLLNFVTQLFGWTPIGKSVAFGKGEGPWASTLTGRIGRIEDVQPQSGRRSSEVIAVVLSEGFLLGGEFVNKVLLVPRHTHYGAIALKTTCISVYVCAANKEMTGYPREEDIFAVTDVCLAA